MMFAKGEQIKMKKLISIALLLAVFILIFSACSPADDATSGYLPLTAYINDGNAEGADSPVSASRQYISVRAEDIPEPASSTLAVTILETQYNANYVSKRPQTFGRPEYTYKTAAGDEISTDETGQILSLETAAMFSYELKDTRNESVKAKLKSAEEYLDIATKLVEEIFGSDVAARLSGSTLDMATTQIWVSFTPRANASSKYRITESISIILSMEGDFLAFYSKNVNAFENKAIPANLTDDRMVQMIADSLVNKNAQIELSDIQNLVVLSDGRIAISTTFKTSGDSAGEWTGVIIPLE